ALPMPSEGGYYTEPAYRDTERDRRDRVVPESDRGTRERDRGTTPTDRSRPESNPPQGNPPPESLIRGPAPATIVVNLPAEAKLLIDDSPTSSTADRRTFVTPPIERGKSYTYTLKADMTRDGQKLHSEKEITVRAGEETRVMIDFAAK